MIKVDRKRVEKVFEDYTSHYDHKNPKIKLKMEHTYRVAAHCDTIARSEKLSQYEQDLAWLCGMLHDVGRFEQERQYGTFEDIKSVDHAKLGAQILFEEGKIRDYIDESEEDEMLRQAIYWHGALRLPTEMTDRTRMFAQILRDADKIDIYKVNVDFSMEDIYNVTTEKLRNAEVSEAVMRSFYEEHTVTREDRKTPVDQVVGHICLTYELIYPISLQIVKEQGYLERLLHFQSQNVKTQQQFNDICNYMNEYLKKHSGE